MSLIRELTRKRRRTEILNYTRELEFARAAYDDEPEVSGWSVVETGANGKVRLWKKDGENEYIISHRGTKPTDLDDIASDVHIGLGTQHRDKQFIDRLEVTKSMLQNIDQDARVTLTGHSLGGTTAAYAMNDKVIRDRISQTVTFNPGTTPISFLTPSFKGDESKIVNIKKEADVISEGRSPGRTVFVADQNPLGVLGRLVKSNLSFYERFILGLPSHSLVFF